VNTDPIVRTFDALLTAGATVSAIVAAFFVMIAGFQYMGAGGSVRAIESAKGSLYNALIGFAIVILCKVIANLIGGALGAPSQAPGPTQSAVAALAL
jgi:Type IV secretion system pilin